MATFTGIQHIGERIFNSLRLKDVLNCRSVCQSWKQILDNPNYWLKKLNSIGQTKKSNQEYTELFSKTSKVNFSVSKLGYCLLIKYCKVAGVKAKTRNYNKIIKYLVDLPLLYFALVQKHPDLDLIKFLSRESSLVAKPVKMKSLRASYGQGNFFEIDPITDAIEKKHSLEVIKTLLTELKMKNPWYGTPLLLAVEKQDFEMCKMIIEVMGVDQIHVPTGRAFSELNRNPITKVQ